MGDDFSSVFSGTWSDIHNIIGFAHSVLVVFHDYHRIAQIPQMLQCSQQLVIIPLVQADAWLIQNICHSHQAGAYLGSQADPLRFSARQASRCP